MSGSEQMNVSGLTQDSSEASSAMRTRCTSYVKEGLLRETGTSVGELGWGEEEARQSSDFPQHPGFCQIPQGGSRVEIIHQSHFF